MKEILKYTKTKKGATSFIIMMFTTMLITIIVLSFASVMLSNLYESSNYDLNQSAYDAAQAGIEDAKVMVLKYNNCIAKGDTSSADGCDAVIDAVTASDSENDCDIINKALNRSGYETETETRIQTGTSENGVDADLDMAYTCVKVATKTDDYISTLNNDNDIKIVPLRTSNSTTDDISPVTKIRIQWYSTTDFTSVKNSESGGVINATTGYSASSLTRFSSSTIGKGTVSSNSQNVFGTNTNDSGESVAVVPPTLQVSLTQTAQSFTFSDFDKKQSNNTANAGSLILRPVLTGDASNSGHQQTSDNAFGSMSSGKVTSSPFATALNVNSYNYGDTTNSYGTVENTPIDIDCVSPENDEDMATYGYACSAYIYLPYAYTTLYDSSSARQKTKDSTRYLIISLPYADTDVSFRVTMFNSSNETVQFDGVQSEVDSTGRANDLFRRVVSRIEVIDTNYPYPKYALAAYGDDDGEGVVRKNNYVTSNYFASDSEKIYTSPSDMGDCESFTSALVSGTKYSGGNINNCPLKESDKWE